MLHTKLTDLKGLLQARDEQTPRGRSKTTEAHTPIKIMKNKGEAVAHHTTSSQHGSTYNYQRLKGPTLFSKRRAWVFSRPLRKMLQIHFATHDYLLVNFDLGMYTLNSFLSTIISKT